MSKENTNSGPAEEVHPLMRKPAPYQRPRRRDRSNYDIFEAMEEISLAETLLDELGADRGLTLWGRIVSLHPERK